MQFLPNSLLNIVEEGHQTRHDLEKGSLQGDQIVSYIPEQSHLND